MSTLEQLPRELVWTESGHLTDVAITAIADGEEAILPREAFGHLGGCFACAASVERAAVFSARVSRGVRAASDVAARRDFPWLGVGVALALAAITTLPRLRGAQLWLLELSSILRHAPPLFARTLSTFLGATYAWLPVASMVAAAMLVMAGLSVARLAPRPVRR